MVRSAARAGSASESCVQRVNAKTPTHDDGGDDHADQDWPRPVLGLPRFGIVAPLATNQQGKDQQEHHDDEDARPQGEHHPPQRGDALGPWPGGIEDRCLGVSVADRERQRGGDHEKTERHPSARRHRDAALLLALAGPPARGWGAVFQASLVPGAFGSLSFGGVAARFVPGTRVSGVRSAC
jgi:hypothetical protein